MVGSKMSEYTFTESLIAEYLISGKCITVVENFVNMHDGRGSVSRDFTVRGNDKSLFRTYEKPSLKFIKQELKHGGYIAVLNCKHTPDFRTLDHFQSNDYAGISCKSCGLYGR